ncbi:MAG TPA: S8 family peptidase [Candidatus Eisenbacteria bacterium]|jgi:hypothetical protein
MASLILASPAGAGPFIWDQDDDHFDDRIETVHLLGYQFSFESADSLKRQRIQVTHGPGDLVYGVYVVYQQPPTSTDLVALAALGMPVLHRYEGIPALRSVATFLQAQAAASLPHVERVEAISFLYPELVNGAAAVGMRDRSEAVYPTWSGMGGAAGEGEVVAILDTGVNDAADGGYPGHESLSGRCLGGAVFLQADSTLDTPRDGSVNPSDHGGEATQGHGTHVAGIILGSGGPSGYAIGMAPSARMVDVKVLNDTGFGTGVAEALDWCIHNRSRNWGVPGYEGIDVINLSLSSLDVTDGNDLASQLANRAVELGMVVVASVGNEGSSHFIPSPAAGDRVLAVGAFDDQRTPRSSDDQLANFSDYGPRASDGDGDVWDEQKPDLIAPGVAVLSADGNPLSDGAQYRRLSGTSMAAAFVSGAVAAMRSACPALAPAAIANLLRSTALRVVGGVPSGESGPDPRWYSPIGFGAIDLYGAMLEATQPGRSQVRRLVLESDETKIHAAVWTQRERGAGAFVFERAPDLGGIAGAFSAYDSVSAAGDSSLADGSNATIYQRDWNVPGNERGVPFWYRVSFTEGGVRTNGPARRYSSPNGPPVATIEVTVVHNAYDHDVDAVVQVGGGGSPGEPSSPLSFPLPGTSAAVSSDWVSGPSASGNVAWTFRVDVQDSRAQSYLPPGPQAPWWLKVTEGGYLNRSGRITSYRIIWHAPGGDQTSDGGPLPMQTLEGQTVTVADPSAIVGGVGVDPGGPAGHRLWPNPVRSGGTVTFLHPNPRGTLRIYDLSGRQVGGAPYLRDGLGYRARWQARDGRGQPLRAGLYFARCGAEVASRLVVLGR